MQVALDDPSRADVVALLSEHLAFSAALSPPEDVHALDVVGLSDRSVSFFSLREGGLLLAIGALKELSVEHLELKSMHTAAAHRGRGVGGMMLRQLLSVAQQGGARRVSLETGSMVEFAPARSLYASAGFVTCGPFADYVVSSHSVFMTLVIPSERLPPAPRFDLERSPGDNEIP